MFSQIFSACKNFFAGITSSLHQLFKRSTIDESALQELQVLLLQADVGPVTTNLIILKLKERFVAQQGSGAVSSGRDLMSGLQRVLAEMLAESSYGKPLGDIVLLVGINGSGKTTTAAKVAALHKAQGKRVLLVAADTFRAAAVAQLTIWAQESNIPLMSGAAEQDPASVVFAACAKWKAEPFDLMIIDTAGRMHTKQHLMDELGKIRRIITKQLPHCSVTTLLTIDSMLGQNSLQQARLFHENTDVNALILTKCDSTGKGGVVLTIFNELKLPIKYITMGEKLSHIGLFSPEEFINTLMGA